MKGLSIVMPKMGESVMEATIIKWLKKEGDMVIEGESILEVATDKVDSEIPAPYTGRLTKILVYASQVIAVGSPIAIMETEDANALQAASTITQAQDAPSSRYIAAAEKTTGTLPQDSHLISYPIYGATGRFYSPLVRSIAQQEHIPIEEMERIPGTGKDNRVTKQDLLAYLSNRKSTQAIPTSAPPIDSIQKYAKPGDEIIPMNRVRKVIADRMVVAMQTIPHVTSFVEADVTNLVTGRAQYKLTFKEKAGVELSYMPIFVKAVADTLQKFPLINVSVVDDYIIKRKSINIGIAVALPDGNLIVPVIKQVPQLSFAELALSIQTLIHKARHGQLLPEDVVDGTYTISNIGTFQNLMGTPMIMPPQVAILAVGAIVKRPAVIETLQGDQIAIRHTMYLSHTYDHRVVDGALGGKFVKAVAEYVENFDIASEVSRL